MANPISRLCARLCERPAQQLRNLLTMTMTVCSIWLRYPATVFGSGATLPMPGLKQQEQALHSRFAHPLSGMGYWMTDHWYWQTSTTTAIPTCWREFGKKVRWFFGTMAVIETTRSELILM